MISLSQTESTFRSGGKSIRLDVFRPSDDTRRCPAVIALHGAGGSHEGMSYPASLLASRGFAVFVLHYFDRTDTTSADKATIFRNFPLWMKTLWDAVSHVEKEAGVDPTRIGLLGFSLGAYLSISIAAIDNRVSAVVEFFGGLPKEMKLFMRRLCPVLILHGDADEVVPVAEAYSLQKVLENRNIPYEIKIYPGAGHGFSGEVWLDAGARTSSFFTRHLTAPRGLDGASPTD